MKSSSYYPHFRQKWVANKIIFIITLLDLKWGTFLLLSYGPDATHSIRISDKELFLMFLVWLASTLYQCIGLFRFHLWRPRLCWYCYSKDHSPSPTPSCGHGLVAPLHFLVKRRPGRGYATCFSTSVQKAEGAGAVMYCCAREAAVCMICKLLCWSVQENYRCLCTADCPYASLGFNPRVLLGLDCW